MSFTLTRGDGPVILAFPHVGTEVPDTVRAELSDIGRELADTDWHVDTLYAGLLPGATTLVARTHRYVIDLNRDPSGASLYPGQNTTGLVPLTDFDGRPLWRDPAGPSEAEIARRVAAIHAPYHAALAAEIRRVKALHGVAVVYDCHSIRAHIPHLFPGTLPDLNIGTNSGASCAPEIAAAAVAAAERAAADGFSFVLDGRFRGGWTTRHHGAPAAGVHTIQMELSQRSHLVSEASPFAYDPAKAERLRPHLAAVLAGIAGAARILANSGRP